MEIQYTIKIMDRLEKDGVQADIPSHEKVVLKASSSLLLSEICKSSNHRGRGRDETL